MREFSTPMMQQYRMIKQQYPDCLLFFRLGDFYELFLDDALIGSKVLDIVLTRRPRGKDGDIPMAGVPYHAADAYIAKLVKAGYKIAMCEQVSEPDKRGIVEREVVRIVTPGTILDEKTLSSKEHNYIMAISYSKDEETIGIAVADISTGDFQVTEVDSKDNVAQIVANEFARFIPAECIINNANYNSPEFLKILNSERKTNISCFEQWDTYTHNSESYLKKHFKVKSLRGFGLHNKKEGQKAAAALLGYLANTQKDRISHLTTLKSYSLGEHVILDASTIHNLELFATIREHDEQGSFIESIDRTKTPMGGRLLRKWIREPLRNKKEIEKRLLSVEALIHERSSVSKAQKILGSMYDIERILSRLAVGLGTPHDLVNLKVTLLSCENIYQELKKIEARYIQELIAVLPELQHIAEIIEKNLVPEPPIDPREGGLIKTGVHAELDALKDHIKDSQAWIAALENKERKNTGINSLKVRFNNIFGYYIEISKANLHLVPSEYMRRQTTINAERFITPELQIHEEKVLQGQDAINKLEYKLFLKLTDQVLSFISKLQISAEYIAIIDCLLGFAEVAQHEHYVRPTMTTDGTIKIEDGRHPVVEQLHDTSFVPNTILLNQSDQQLLVITGPNMAGKSVLMRQVALITLMAHIGSFVPAKRASISLVDRIFVRSGASDSIGRGLSTFMVEMVETAYILNHATQDSLIIMDEIGRGTSTYDGISIAWSVAEYLVTHKVHAAKTLFATHYHELQKLEEEYPEKIKNYHMAIEEVSTTPIFLYRIVRGGAHGSYAIAVAKLAGVPNTVADRAAELLLKFNTSKTTN